MRGYTPHELEAKLLSEGVDPEEARRLSEQPQEAHKRLWGDCK